MNQTTLHLIFSPDAWTKAKPLVDVNDQVLLLQDAVYLVAKNDLGHNCKQVFVRQLDMSARNIHPAADYIVIDDTKWVELTTAAHNLISW
ncbi:DsrH/TusB family sulfur metabolism protein [Psychrosphaera aquimarina]|uniref:DsrH/TusB family sulfur metabolism protein n=1 Tax=Psychrosphaera aquimarina TaxID=2044854 RepID=A0ABU3R4A8_9GAMM|nr:DsrH/TusB family sulfur metabolism protein [Psychrosphaera aquimarina]MDU0114527.1 DsrH/TusB family sulfur metabolism protein [Psychrosphaera aquimarina]